MPKKAKSCTCDLCCKPIIEGKEEALECEGECGKWYHRYCTGISMTHFKRLSTTTSPFVCFPCNQLVQEAKVSQLLSEVESPNYSNLKRNSKRVSATVNRTREELLSNGVKS